MIQAISFSVFCYVVYGYLLVLGVEVLFEQKFRAGRWMRPVGILVVLGLLSLFRWGFVMAKDPLVVRASCITGEYDPGTVIAGIKWRPEYSDTRVLFKNDTDNNYQDLDVVINTDQFISASTETTLIGCKVFNTDTGQDTVTMPVIDKKTGRKHILSQDKMSFFSGGIHVMCDKLPKHNYAEILLAVAHPDPERKALYGPRKDPTLVGVNGTYTSIGGRPRTIKDVYKVVPR